MKSNDQPKHYWHLIPALRGRVTPTCSRVGPTPKSSWTAHSVLSGGRCGKIWEVSKCDSKKNTLYERFKELIKYYLKRNALVQFYPAVYYLSGHGQIWHLLNFNGYFFCEIYDNLEYLLLKNGTELEWDSKSGFCYPVWCKVSD